MCDFSDSSYLTPLFVRKTNQLNIWSSNTCIATSVWSKARVLDGDEQIKNRVHYRTLIFSWSFIFLIISIWADESFFFLGCSFFRFRLDYRFSDKSFYNCTLYLKHRTMNNSGCETFLNVGISVSYNVVSIFLIFSDINIIRPSASIV